MKDFDELRFSKYVQDRLEGKLTFITDVHFPEGLAREAAHAFEDGFAEFIKELKRKNPFHEMANR